MCRHCQRWNLTPFDARWEALEQCERAYRDTRVRLSTDNIGLARLRDGTDLVRIGRPLLPEFAAWRYGDQFGRRRVRNVLMGGGLVAGGALAIAGIATAGMAVAAIVPIVHVALTASLFDAQVRAMRNPVLLGDGRRIPATGSLRLLELPVEEGWGVEAGIMEHMHTVKGDARIWNQLEQQYVPGVTTVRGRDAMPLLRRYLPKINGSGANAVQVRDGVAMIDEAGGPERFGAWAAAHRRAWAAAQTQGDTGSLRHIPVAARLAFEMSVNEDAERRALAGELTQLEAQWRDAEEVAAIADRLALPRVVDTALDTLRRRMR